MAVTYVAAGTLGAVAANPPTFSLTLPVCQVDDVILIFVMNKRLGGGANETNTPQACTLKGSIVQIDAAAADDDMRVALFWKRATGADSGGTITISRAGTSALGLYAQSYAFRGCVQGDPFDTTAPSVNGDITVDAEIEFAAFDATSTSAYVCYFGWQADDITTTPGNLVNGAYTFTFRNEQETITGTDATAILWSAQHDGANLAAFAMALTTTTGSSYGYTFGLLPATPDTLKSQNML